MNSQHRPISTSRPHDTLCGTPLFVVLLVSFCYGISPLAAQVEDSKLGIAPLSQAHAHNDYLHPRPLLDALDQGFCSVEADVFLVDGELLVAHTAFELQRKRTLKKLYLDPLRERVSQNDGRVYRDGPVFTLLIDFKQNGKETYAALDAVLAEYPEVFSAVQDGKAIEKAVNVVISGDRPFATVAADPQRYAGLDGRLADIGSDKPVHLMPMISDRWGSHFKWRGEGEMTADERIKLQQIVSRVHSEGRVLRFWAIPDNPNGWNAMRAAGVDLINTDNLSGLRQFLRKPH